MDLEKTLSQAGTYLKFIDPVALHHFCARNQNLRPTISVQDRERSLRFGPERGLNLNPPSSEEDSDPESQSPGVYQVTEKILDTEYTQITDEPPPVQFHAPTLIICGLDPRIRLNTIISSINSLGQGVKKVSLVEFGENPTIHTALIAFDTMVAGKQQIAKELYRKLRKYEKDSVLGSKIHMIPGLVFNTTARWFTYRVLDPNLEWTAVVLRDLTLYKTAKDIQKKLGKYCLRVETPRVIRGQLCTLVVVRGLFDGKKIVSNLKNLGIAGYGDLHPYSSCFKKPIGVAGYVFKEFSKVDYSGFVSGEAESEVDAISSISSSEEGEITNGEMVSDKPGYQLVELAGEYVTREKELCFHSGVCIKTSFSARLSNN